LATQSRLLQFQFKYRTLLQVLTLPLLAAVTWLIVAGRGRGYAEHLIINAYAMSAVNLLYALLFGVLLITEHTPAFEVAWAIGTAVPAAYKTIALYAVFARPGRRRSTALMALTATAVSLGAQMTLLYALGVR